jgi:hypothetical protein
MRKTRMSIALLAAAASCALVASDGSCEVVRRAAPRPEDAAEEPDADHETDEE